jgi:hypothetical protein
VTVESGNYYAPASVTRITITGSGQHVMANDVGDVIVDNGVGSYVTGGAGNDIVFMGNDTQATSGGSGGTDEFIFDSLPQTADWIGLLKSGDKVSVQGLLASEGYTGEDPIGDGYLKLTAGGNYDGTQLWTDPDGAGGPAGWTLVATIDHSPPSSLHYTGGWLIMA